MSLYVVYVKEAKDTGVSSLFVLWYSVRDVYGSFLGQGKNYDESLQSLKQSKSVACQD